MTQHHIVGSEAFAPGPHVQVHTFRRRGMHPAVKIHAIGAGIGLVTGCIDVALGTPVTLIVALAGLTAWRFWPSGR